MGITSNRCLTVCRKASYPRAVDIHKHRADAYKRGGKEGANADSKASSKPERNAPADKKRSSSRHGQSGEGGPQQRSEAHPRTDQGRAENRVPSGIQVPDGLLKQVAPGAAASMGLTKVAHFLMLVGKEQAATILKHLSEEEVELIARTIATTPRLDPEESRRILEEFGGGAALLRVPQKGGPDFAERLLQQTFGEQEGGRLFRRIVPDRRGRYFQFLSDLDAAQMRILLKGESVPVVSLVLAKVKPLQAARVLGHLEPEMRTRVVRWMARMSRVDHEVVLRVEETLREKIRTQGKVVSNEIDGRAALAAILRTMNFSGEADILRSLQEEDPELYAQIKDQLFTSDSLVYIDDADLQRVLRDFDNHQIALFLKGKTDEIRSRILMNVSERRRTLIADDYRDLGAVRKADVAEAEEAFLGHLRQLEEEGKLVVRRPDEEYI